LKLEAGESYTYRVTIDDDGTLYGKANSPWTFGYTGAVQQFVVPATGNYRLEAWGAQGGGTNGGKGGYAQGEIALTQGEILYIYVGQAGATDSGGWNGGGRGAIAGNGGGGTDFRTVDGAWNLTASLNSRFLVAGGGGGQSAGNNNAGGHGGGASGGNGSGTYYGAGGTQTGGGAGGHTPGWSAAGTGTFGVGGAGGTGDYNGGGGGGGWYGGGGGDDHGNTTSCGGGGGGSGFVSGVTAGDSSHTPPKTFTSGGTIAGNANMTNPSGGTMTGRSGNGYARITLQ
jgi:hypothetical protein